VPLRTYRHFADRDPLTADYYYGDKVARKPRRADDYSGKKPWKEVLDILRDTIDRFNGPF
jgi:hypothetical protein